MSDYSSTLTMLANANMGREAFEELSEQEYAALVRMAQSQGVESIARMIGPLPAADRHATLSAFMAHEVQTAQKRIAALELVQDRVAALEAEQRQIHAQQEQAAARPKRPTPLKVDVGKYRGTESESLLRWLVEVDAAIDARCIEDEHLKVAFAMSNLAGRAKTWAFGRRLADSHCFNTYILLKQQLRETFEPPKSEFRARAEFLDIKQGKRDIAAYCQYARYLVSCVVNDRIDDSTQVVAFMKGLTDGPVKTYLFREYPHDLEEAISLAMQEDFSMQQAYVHSSTYRPPRSREMHDSSDGVEPMDLSAAETQRFQRQRGVCDRCGKRGHMAYECMAPRPMARPRTYRDGSSGSTQRNDNRFDRRRQSESNRARSGERRPRRTGATKNEKAQ